ncbi:right-handed parallel beta-helix repeat-containing protein [Magnetococcales bacterium HHB-1]
MIRKRTLYGVLWLLLLSLPLHATGAFYIPEDQLPRILAIPSPTWLKSSPYETYVPTLIRQELKTRLLDKGFSTIESTFTDRCFPAMKWQSPANLAKKIPQKIKKGVQCLQRLHKKVDGILWPAVSRFHIDSVLVMENRAFEAQVILFDTQGKKLGTWQDEASAGSVALSPLSALTHSIDAQKKEKKQQSKNLIHDWGENITAMMPGFSSATEAPRIDRLTSTIEENQWFKEGDTIQITLEGERSMRGAFDLGHFKKQIPLTEEEPGFYKGAYHVKQDDYAKNLSIEAYLTNAMGRERRRTLQSIFHINGQRLPLPPPILWRPDPQGITLSWSPTNKKTLKQKITWSLSRATHPSTKFIELANIEAHTWLDHTVKPHQHYIYQIQSRDLAGNLSPKRHGGPVTFEPNQAPRILTRDHLIKYKKISGAWRLQSPLIIDKTETLHLEQAQIAINQQGKILLQGQLTALNSQFFFAPETKPTTAHWQPLPDPHQPSLSPPLKKPENKNSTPPGYWPGIRVNHQAKVIFNHVKIRHCTRCLDIRGGEAKIENSHFEQSQQAIHFDSARWLSLKKSTFKNTQQALTLIDGEVAAKESHFKENQTAILFSGGTLRLQFCNLINNQIHILANRPITLSQNYFSPIPENQKRLDLWRLRGGISLISRLKNPWPKQEIIHYSKPIKTDISPLPLSIAKQPITLPPAPKTSTDQTVNKKTALWHTMRNMAFKTFEKRHYSQAEILLNKVLHKHEDKQTRLRLALTLNALKKSAALEHFLQQSLKRYPKEKQFYLLSIRHDLANNQHSKAHQLLQKARQQWPNDARFEGLRFMVKPP